MLHRLAILTINIFFPPLAVLLLTGPYTDTLLNSILFLCGVIPSHIHAFYISCTYFHRRRKVRKGKWPGGPKALIFDRQVWYGGVTRAEAEELKEEQEARRRGGWMNEEKRRSGSVLNVGGHQRQSHASHASGGSVRGYDRRSQVANGGAIAPGHSKVHTSHNDPRGSGAGAYDYYEGGVWNGEPVSYGALPVGYDRRSQVLPANAVDMRSSPNLNRPATASGPGNGSRRKGKRERRSVVGEVLRTAD